MEGEPDRLARPPVVADLPFADIRAVTVEALLRRSEPLPTDVKLFGSLHIHLHGGAGTHEIAVAVNIVDAVDRRPILVHSEGAWRKHATSRE